MFVLAFYEIDREYGGAEEGGWWYDTGRLVRSFKLVRNEEKAVQTMDRANRLLKRLQRNKRSESSVIYSGGRHRVYVFADTAPRRFPEERPYYE
jgi:hypothetical protein